MYYARMIIKNPPKIVKPYIDEPAGIIQGKVSIPFACQLPCRELVGPGRLTFFVWSAAVQLVWSN